MPEGRAHSSTRERTFGSCVTKSPWLEQFFSGSERQSTCPVHPWTTKEPKETWHHSKKAKRTTWRTREKERKKLGACVLGSSMKAAVELAYCLESSVQPVHAPFNTLEHVHRAVQCSKELSASAAHPRGTHASSPCSFTVDPINWLAESVLWTVKARPTKKKPNERHVQQSHTRKTGRRKKRRWSFNGFHYWMLEKRHKNVTQTFSGLNLNTINASASGLWQINPRPSHLLYT